MATVPKCDRCKAVDVQVVPVLGRDLCVACTGAFRAWVGKGEPRPAPTSERIRDIQQAACDYFGLTVEDLVSRSRMRRVSRPRMIAMALARNRLGASLQAIGDAFGRDHATVSNALDCVRALIEADDRSTLAALECCERALNDETVLMEAAE